MKPLLIFLLISLPSLGQISPERKLQLDSFVYHLPRGTQKNLDSLHITIDNYGKNSEEKVFMFYGVFALHFTYDNKRLNSHNTNEYTPYYTCQKQTGVCRDFSALFKELCTRSNIPCIEAAGKTKSPFRPWLKRFLLLKNRDANHVWNIVRYNNTWHLMDPTWTGSDSTHKYYSYNENNRRILLGKTKIANREYYDAIPEEFYKKRNTIHPAFYLMEKVPTYNSARRKFKNQVYLDTSIRYSVTLNKFISDSLYLFSKELNEQCKEYSKQSASRWFIQMKLLSLDLKRTKINPLDESEYQKLSQELTHLVDYLAKEDVNSYNLDNVLLQVDEELLKLQRKITAQH